ncbi:MAG: transporter related protein [Frankiales bacterium]|nr:transporter related protein [Frankiales bacterium]
MDLIQFERVSKRYVIGQRMNAREAVAQATSRLLRRGASPSSELWSIKDVSFSVRDGEALGIVGRNGAGKSTILKILAGITAPTSGSSRTRGRVAALLEVGTGFHPELTGRENIYLNGAILGMSRRDITLRFAQIVDFSGVDRFLDTPVKRYSSGMYLRLAFAVAAHLEPDVLVVDEILAVGDAEFQRKCIGRMHEAEAEGRTLVFVSHDLDSLTKICQRSLWLEGGEIRDSGPTPTIVRDYLNSGLAPAERGHGLAITSGPITVAAVRVRPDSTVAGGADAALMFGDQLRVEIEFDVSAETPGLDLAVMVTTGSGVRVLDELLSEQSITRFTPGSYRVEVLIPPLLNAGDYSIGLWFGTPHEEFLAEPAAAMFSVHGGDPTRPDRIVAAKLPFAVHRLASINVVD